MPDAYQCPKCKEYIIGEFCYECNINIRDHIDFFKDVFNEDIFNE